MSNPVVSELIELLQLERFEENLFRGQSRDIGTRFVFGGQVLGFRHVRHVDLVFAAGLVHLERCGEIEDRLTMLDRDDPANRKTLAVARAIDVVDDRRFDVAGTEKIRMQRVHRAIGGDHALWFHRPFRADEWLLYACDSPSAQGARGLTRGMIYSRDGRLVASTAQEGLIRLLPE